MLHYIDLSYCASGDTPTQPHSTYGLLSYYWLIAMMMSADRVVVSTWTQKFEAPFTLIICYVKITLSSQDIVNKVEDHHLQW